MTKGCTGCLRHSVSRGVSLPLHIQEGKKMTEKLIQRYGQRVGYTQEEVERFHEGGHRIRQVSRLSRAAAKHSIQAEVVSSKNCNSGHAVGQTFILDVDGNFITKLCPNRMCVYLISQITIPVALINPKFPKNFSLTVHNER
jgi:hypothetical protein